MIPGATSATFVVSASDTGQRLSVRVAASALGYAPAEATSALTAVVASVPARVTLSASSTKQAYGTKKPVWLTAKVTAPGADTAGMVQFRDGAHAHVARDLRTGNEPGQWRDVVGREDHGP